MADTFFSRTKSGFESQSLAVINGTKNAVSNEVMRGTSRSGSGVGYGFGGSGTENEIYYQQYKQWVYVCIDAIVTRLKSLNWIAGSLVGATNNPERAARFGVKTPGKSFQKLSGEMAMLDRMPSELRVKLAQGHDFESIPNHTVLDLLESPNPVMHRPEYIHMLGANLLLTGEAYIIGGEYSQSDVGFELWPIPTKWITPVHNGGFFTSYVFTPQSFGGQKEIPAVEVTRIYFPHPEDPSKAYGPLQACFRSARVDDKLQKGQEEQFDAGFFPNVALKVGKLRNADGTEGRRPILDARHHRQITRAVRQVWNQTTANRQPAILDGLIEDVLKLTHSPQEMDWPNSGKMIKDRIYQTFRVNPIIAGEMQGVNRSQAAVVEKSFCGNVVNPLADAISTAHTEFIGPWFKNPKRLVVYLEHAIPEDEELKLKKFAEARKNNDVTSNEFRTHVLNLPPLEPEDRDEERNPLLTATGALQNTITLAEKVNNHQINRESAIKIVTLFLGVDDASAGEMFPEPPEKQEPVLPFGIVPPKPGEQPVQLQDDEQNDDGEDDGEEMPEPETEDDAKKWARRAAQSVFIKSAQAHEKAIINSSITLLRKQIDSAADNLKMMDGSKVAMCVGKSMGDTAQAMTYMIFDVSKWLEPLIKFMAPAMSKAFVAGAKAEKALLESATDEKSTASDLIQQMLLHGESMDMEIATEWPQWLREATQTFLTNQFAEDYWQGINMTTSNDIRGFIEYGLNEGLSIRQIASSMQGSFTDDYYMTRGKLIARTETGDALNAGHEMAIRQTQEETGLETGKEWLSVMGNTTRRTHGIADGQIVGVNEQFSVGGYQCPHPSHHSLPASERCNCQCTVIASFGMSELTKRAISWVKTKIQLKASQSASTTE